MKANMKWLGFLVISLVVFGLKLGGTGTALAAFQQGDTEPGVSEFSLLGVLASKTPVAEQPLLETWTVDGQDFLVTTAPAEPPAEGAADISAPTVCSNPVGEVIACAEIEVNELISVSGEKVHTSGSMVETLYAATIQVQSDPAEGGESYTYTGVLMSMDSHSAVIGEFTFVGDEATIRPDFFGLGDTIFVAYSILENGVYYATSAEILEQAAPYSYTGNLEGIVDNGDGTFTWNIGGKSFIANSETSLPESHDPGDEVKVSFLVQAGVNLALSIELVAAHVPPITEPPISETELCVSGFENHPEILKRAEEMGITNPAALLDYFCNGVSLDDIKHAILLAAGSEFAPEDLLAMLTSGMSWEEIEAQVKGSSGEGGDGDDPSEGSHEPEEPSLGGYEGEALRRYIKTLNLQFPGRFGNFFDPNHQDASDEPEHSDANTGDSDPDYDPGDNDQDEECTDNGG
jgi:hypothetical protein